MVVIGLMAVDPKGVSLATNLNPGLVRIVRRRLDKLLELVSSRREKRDRRGRGRARLSGDRGRGGTGKECADPAKQATAGGLYCLGPEGRARLIDGK
jgi:hypothetical protein